MALRNFIAKTDVIMKNGDFVLHHNHQKKDLDKHPDHRTKQPFTTLKWLCVLIFVMTASVYASSDPENGRKQTETEGGNVCTTPACLRTSDAISSAIDLTVDPCQDFYRYACGRWSLRNPATEDLSFSSPMMQLHRITVKELKASLEETDEVGVSQAERNARRYYQSCLNFNASNKKPLLDLLEQIGGWPAIQNNETSNKNYTSSLQKSLQQLHSLNADAFFKWVVTKPFTVHPALPKDQPFIVIKPSDLTLSNKDSYANDMVGSPKSKLLDTLMKIGSWLNDGVPSSLMLASMQQIVALETRIAQIINFHSASDGGANGNIVSSISDLQKELPLVDWYEYFNSMFSQVNTSVSSPQPVVVYSFALFRNLSSLIIEILQTENGEVTLQNYLAWNLVRRYVPKIFLKDVLVLLDPSIGNLSDSEFSWNSCVGDTVNTAMGYATGALFVRRIMRDDTIKLVESRKLAKSMLTSVKEAFKRNLESLDWMDSETFVAAKVKIDTMSDIIGYPEFILNPVELDKYYHGLVVHADEYIQNKVRANQFMFLKEMVLLKRSKDATEFFDRIKSPLFVIVNALYLPFENQMIFPVSILREPIFDVSLPAAVNFGAFGSSMGHELTHGFDDDGRRIDHEGKFRNWWNSAPFQGFLERTDCFVKQYWNYSIDNEAVSGMKTINENIADNGGVKTAFKAFTEWRQSYSQKEDNLVLPGLNVTQNQLFFLSYAQLWCASSEKEFSSLKSDDPHSPERYRVLGPLSNMREFSSAFQCPLGTQMNPIHKCEVW